jgi:hypothetical protein
LYTHVKSTEDHQNGHQIKEAIITSEENYYPQIM